MEDRRDEDSGAIAWPGFVDILSAVIIMFVFFVMITAIVMFVMSVENKKQMEAESEKKVIEEVESLKQQLMVIQEMTPEQFTLQMQKAAKVQNLSEENQRLNEEIVSMNSEIKQLKADLAESKDQNTVLDEDNNEMIVLYNKNEMSLSPATKTMLEEFLKKNPRTGEGQPRIVLETGDAPDSSSVSLMRELALARTLNIRNVMLEQEAVGADQISVTYTESEKIKDSYHWVKVKIQYDE